MSKEVNLKKIPIIQRKICKFGKKYKTNVFVATNFLESMVENNYPTTGEVNDIYTTLEMSAKGLVLAAETAIGKYPIECVQYFNEFIKFYKTEK